MGQAACSKATPFQPVAATPSQPAAQAGGGAAPKPRAAPQLRTAAAAAVLVAEVRPSRIVMANAAQIEDVYEMTKQLGEGAYGSVFLAKHKITNDMRAVKKVNKGGAASLKALQKEIAVMKLMDHPNVIKLHETFEDRKNTYMVMDLASGGELFDRIVKAKHLSEATAGIVMQQIIRGVFYMHGKDVAHRDLKPENYLFATKDPIEGNTLKLIDFGLACPCTDGQVLRTKLGTAMYMAPQVAIGRYDKMCDMWSVGVIMYILLSGRAPIMGKTEQCTVALVREGRWGFDGRWWDDVSDDAKDLIRSCMKMNPKQRIAPEAALRHKWVEHTAPRATDKILGADVLARIQGFEASNKLKRAALEIAARNVDEQKIRELRELFESLDENGDGELSIAELASGMRNSGIDIGGLDVDSVISRLDSDKSGSIDYTEFLAATLDRKADLTEEVLWRAFNVFDQNGDGKITQQELKNVMKSTNISSANIVEAMKSVDLDGDGNIDFDEFVAMVRTRASNASVASRTGAQGGA